MTESASTTNKTTVLGKPRKASSTPSSKNVVKSQKALLNSHRCITHFSGDLDNLEHAHKMEKLQHRKLLRKENSAEDIQRDSDIFEIFGANPSAFFNKIRANSRNAIRKISQLKVASRTYTGANVPDGFYDHLLHLKTFNEDDIQDPESYARFSYDFDNIIKLCNEGTNIPEITLEKSMEILGRIRPNVNDLHSITANHFIHAGKVGANIFFLLLKALLSDIKNVTIDEVNIVHAAILFKGHSKDKTIAQSYRTISTCPIVAKALDIYIRDLNIEAWNSNQSEVQFLGEGSSHELAALLLTEIIQYSLYVLKQPLFVIYLDARSAFDKVMRELLVRNLYHAGTTGQELLLVNNRLKNRKTVVEWDGIMMGPIEDQGGLEQGGVNSGDFYKIFGKKQLQLAQDSGLGVQLARNINISAVGQADDTLHTSNNIHRLQNLLQLTLFFCSMLNVEFSTEKTNLQAFFTKDIAKDVEYLKVYSPISIHGKAIEFSETAEHVGIIRSVSGNLPNVLARMSAHKKALGATLHSGSARHHRGNPLEGLKVEQLYGSPVLLSGLGALVLKKSELSILDQHHKDTLQNLLRLQSKSPRCVVYFLSGSLPFTALIHLRQLSLFGMISRLKDSVLYKHAVNALHTKQSSHSWFHQIRDICLQYQLPHPLTTLADPPSKEVYKITVKKQIINYCEIVLRSEAAELPSLHYFHPEFMSLATSHSLLGQLGHLHTKSLKRTSNPCS